MYIYYIYNLARNPEIGQGLERILSCGACKPDGPMIIVDSEAPPFFYFLLMYTEDKKSKSLA